MEKLIDQLNHELRLIPLKHLGYKGTILTEKQKSVLRTFANDNKIKNNYDELILILERVINYYESQKYFGKLFDKSENKDLNLELFELLRKENIKEITFKFEKGKKIKIKQLEQISATNNLNTEKLNKNKKTKGLEFNPIADIQTFLKQLYESKYNSHDLKLYNFKNDKRRVPIHLVYYKKIIMLFLTKYFRENIRIKVSGNKLNSIIYDFLEIGDFFPGKRESPKEQIIKKWNKSPDL